MDAELKRLIDAQGENEIGSVMAVDLSGTIAVKTPEGRIVHVLKPLQDLYGKGVNAATIDPQSHEYMPLFIGIEGEIVQHWERDPELTDGQVLLALDRLAMKPECDIGENELVGHLQIKLRLSLSLHDYSRKDVQRALRIISKSVARHTRQGGRQGYLEFIRQFL